MPAFPTRPGPRPLQVHIVAVPDAAASTLFGLHDVLNAFALMPLPGVRSGAPAPFEVRIVGERAGPVRLASGVTVEVRAATEPGDVPDLAIVPSVLLRPDGWRSGRYPALVEWLGAVHARGTVFCSACSGIFLLAETGAWDGRDATVHFDYAAALVASRPAVRVHPERVLVVAGARDELVSSGASTTWHDLVLYLIARYVGATAAQAVARTFALQWHHDGLAPYIVFEGRTDHGDAEILAAQQWLARHFPVANPVEAVVARSKLAARTFKRRFVQATGLAPLAYVQRLRVEDAKRRLERTAAPIDEIGWRVGYEDAAFFRRLFRRTTGLAPGAYRRRFQIPDFARPGAARPPGRPHPARGTQKR